MAQKLVNLAALLAAGIALSACMDDEPAAAPAFNPDDYEFVRVDGQRSDDSPARTQHYNKSLIDCQVATEYSGRGTMQCMQGKGYTLHHVRQIDAVRATYRASPKPMPKG